MWPEAEHALRLALAAAGELSGLRSRPPDKQRARSGVQGIGALAALSAVRAGDPAAAALHLEQASATLLAESLGIRGDSVRFPDITAACRSMGRSILYLGCSPACGLGVLADPQNGCRAVELPALTEEAVNAAVTEFRAALAAVLAADQDQDQDASEAGSGDPLGACYAAGERLRDWTWASALAPLRDLLVDTGRLAVLPLGRLAWLPLAAAGPRERAPTLATPPEPHRRRAAAARRQQGRSRGGDDDGRGSQRRAAPCPPWPARDAGTAVRHASLRAGVCAGSMRIGTGRFPVHSCPVRDGPPRRSLPFWRVAHDTSRTATVRQM